jgi:hypothetical protein
MDNQVAEKLKQKMVDRMKEYKDAPSYADPARLAETLLEIAAISEVLAEHLHRPSWSFVQYKRAEEVRRRDEDFRIACAR